LDQENRQLLAQERIDAVIDHDLQRDARNAFQAILQHHGFVPGNIITHAFSRVSVVTPFNLSMVDGTLCRCLTPKVFCHRRTGGEGGKSAW
jgi:LacI family transcriptional regulator